MYNVAKLETVVNKGTHYIYLNKCDTVRLGICLFSAYCGLNTD